MAYKYESILKTFEYSKANYQIISDFLLSGNMTNPNIMLNVTEISKQFGKEPKYWFRISTVIEFTKALIRIKINNGDEKLIKIFIKFIKNENLSEVINTHLTQNSELIDILHSLDYKQLQKLMKEFGLISIKRGNLKGSKNGKSIQGTWIHKDLAIEYARWLDPEFSIWISQKIQELISDGVAWNEIRLITRLDYKPLTDAIAKYVIPKYAKMNKNYVYGRIANFINVKVMGQKAKDIRLEKGIEDDELTRDFFIKKELKQIEEVQVFTEIVISHFQKLSFKEIEAEIEKYQVKN